MRASVRALLTIGRFVLQCNQDEPRVDPSDVGWIRRNDTAATAASAQRHVNVDDVRMSAAPGELPDCIGFSFVQGDELDLFPIF